MADGSALTGWTGPTVLVDGQQVPLINIRPSPQNSGISSTGDSSDITAKITNAANQHGVDPDFALKIAHAESSLNPDATSPKGAHGVMQLMPDTAKGLGVDPHNVDQNIDGGVRYLKQLSDKYGGNKSLIAAAYNAGPGAVDQHGGVPPYPETQAYVNKVVGSQGRPTGDADWDKGEVVNNTPSVGTSVAPVRNQAAPDWEQGKPINAGVPLDNAGVAQAPKSPGYQKALSQAQQNPNALATGLANAFNPETALSQNKPEVRPFNSALNGYLFHSLPVIQGGANAIGQALTNLFNNKSGISAKEAFQAGRDASQQDLSSFGQRHPVLNTAADLGGQLTTSAALPEAKGVGLGARLLAGAAKVGGQSALTGAGSAASEGQSPADIAKSAAMQGAIGTALSPVGEAGELGAHAFKSTGGKAVARLLAPSVIGGGLATAGTYNVTKNPKEAALAGLMVSGASGMPGLVKSKAAQNLLTKIIPAEDKSAALMSLTKGIGAETPEGAAIVLEQHPGKSVIEALNKDHREDLMQTAGELNPNNLQHAQQVIETRQAPTVVKGRLKGSLENAIGENPENVSERITSAPHEESTQLALNSAKEKADLESKATSEALVGNGVNGISKAVGVDPRTAESTWEGITKNNRETVSKPLWEKVATTEPGITEDHAKILAEEPIAREALSRAQKVLGDEGSIEAPNPKYNPNASKPITTQDVSDNYAAYLKDYVKAQDKGEAPLSKTSSGWPTIEEIADWKNKGSNHSTEPETITVPTKKAMIQMERDLRYKYMPRDAFGKVDYSNPQTREVERTQQSINAANKQHYEGLEEAKAASGEDLASERANENAYDFNPKSLNSESAEKFIERYNKLGDMQQKATRYGYLERFFQKFRENPVATSKEYLNSDQHQKVMKAMLGNKADAMNAQLKETVASADRAKNYKAETSGPIAETIGNARKLIGKENLTEFNHGYEADSRPELYKDTYTDHLNQTVNGIKSPEGNIEPSHLKDAEHLITSDFHKAVQDRLYGKEKADQIRESIRQEIALAKHGKDVTDFNTKQNKEGQALKVVPSSAFGYLTSGVKGALTGAFGAMQYQLAEHAHTLYKQGDMNPAARQYLGETLAKPTEQVVKELREVAAHKRNMKASESQLTKRALHTSAAIGANAIGPPITHALSNVNAN